MLGRGQLIDQSNVPGPFDWIVGILGLIAFGFTAWQLWRSANALEVARKTYEETQAAFVKSQTIRDIGLLMRHVQDLSAGAHQTDRAEAESNLVAFVDIGSRILALLELSTLPGTPREGLSAVLDSASAARHHLHQAPEPTTTNYQLIGQTTFQGIEQVTSSLNTWSTTLQLTSTTRKEVTP